MWLEVGGVTPSVVPMADNSPNTQVYGKFTVYESNWFLLLQVEKQKEGWFALSMHIT